MLARVPGWESVSVVVPVFNAEATLDELVDRIEASLAGRDHEIVLVNDGSADGSWARIVALAAEHALRCAGSTSRATSASTTRSSPASGPPDATSS